MALSISTAARNAAVDALTALLNAGGAGSITIYTGAKPADPATAASGTVLATLTLPNPAFGASASGTANLGNVASVTATATGTAGWFRAKSGAGTAVLDGTVGANGADLNLNSTAITSGGTVSITSGTITLPGS